MVNIQKFRKMSTKKKYMPDSLEVVDMQVPMDENGNPLRDSWGDPLPAVPVTLVWSQCRIRSQGGDELVLAGRLSVTTTNAIDYPIEVELSANQTVRVADVDYDVMYIETRSEGISAHRTAFLSRS